MLSKDYLTIITPGSPAVDGQSASVTCPDTTNLDATTQKGGGSASLTGKVILVVSQTPDDANGYVGVISKELFLSNGTIQVIGSVDVTFAQYTYFNATGDLLLSSIAFYVSSTASADANGSIQIAAVVSLVLKSVIAVKLSVQSLLNQQGLLSVISEDQYQALLKNGSL